MGVWGSQGLDPFQRGENPQKMEVLSKKGSMSMCKLRFFTGSKLGKLLQGTVKGALLV